MRSPAGELGPGTPRVVYVYVYVYMYTYTYYGYIYIYIYIYIRPSRQARRRASAENRSPREDLGIGLTSNYYYCYHH